jgi:hypothetical protein
VLRSGLECLFSMTLLIGFPWHQDASFLKPLARARFEAHGGVNVVVALDQSEPGNGGFTVLGRTHRAGEPTALRSGQMYFSRHLIRHIVHRCLPRHPPHTLPVPDMSCITLCTGAGHVIHCIVYQCWPHYSLHVYLCSPRHLPHVHPRFLTA